MDPAEQVVAAAEARASALGAGDRAALVALLHQEFRWVTHRGQSFGREEYVERNTGGTTVWRSQVLERCEAVVVGGTAVLHTVVRDVVVAADGTDEAFRMPVTQVWVEDAVGWRCLAGHAGPRLG